MKFRGFQFSFKKDMLEMTEKSSEIYCLPFYAYFMMGKQVINHKLRIPEVSIPDKSFTILLLISMVFVLLMRNLQTLIWQ